MHWREGMSRRDIHAVLQWFLYFLEDFCNSLFQTSYWIFCHQLHFLTSKPPVLFWVFFFHGDSLNTEIIQECTFEPEQILTIWAGNPGMNIPASQSQVFHKIQRWLAKLISSHSFPHSLHQYYRCLLLQVMVWGGKGHGLFFQDFTDEWKRPAREQWMTPPRGIKVKGLWPVWDQWEVLCLELSALWAGWMGRALAGGEAPGRWISLDCSGPHLSC